MADASSSFFNDKLCRHDITAIVKYHLCVSQFPWFCQRPYYYFSLYVYFDGKFEFCRKFPQYHVIITSDFVIVSIAAVKK